jgi:hypothetical protein
VDSILAGLEASFGFKHSMILVPGEPEGVLVTLATHGYAEDGTGAEVRLGEGIAGMVAEARKPIRISGLMLRWVRFSTGPHLKTLPRSGWETQRPSRLPDESPAAHVIAELSRAEFARLAPPSSRSQDVISESRPHADLEPERSVGT